jgi:formylglycine-generating enzyme required for sulfatase activity
LAAGRERVAAGARKGSVYLLRAKDASQESSRQVADSPVRCVAFNGDETVVAAGTDQGDLRLLRVAGAEVVARLTPHRDGVTAVSFAGNGLLASGSHDKTVKLWRWDGEALTELLTLRQPGPVRWLGFHADGVRLFVLLEDERAVRVWHLDGLRSRFLEMHLDAGLEGIEPVPLPSPVPVPAPEPPATETPQGPNGLRAELFTDMDLRHCVKVRYDPQIDFDWGRGSPDRLLPADYFSIRWTGWLKAPKPGKYTLRLEADDGARLWLDGRLLIDYWRWLPGNSSTAEVDLTAQPHEMRVEYVEVADEASIHLSWALKDGFGMQPVPPWALFHDRATAEKAIAPPFALLPLRRSTAAEVLRARRAWAEHLGQKEEEEIDLGDGVKMKMMLVPPGKFLMGSAPAEQALARKNAKEEGLAVVDTTFADEVQHEVEITRPYYLGAFPVTQGQYEKVMGKNPSRFTKERGGGPNHPVEQVSWQDAVTFCEELSKLEKGSGRHYRLSTEAEWEYACREGGSSTTAFHYGDSLSSSQANFNGKFPFGGAPKDVFREKSTPVGTFKPNALGLFDMHGNVWQWCADYHGPYDLTKTTDPSGPDKGNEQNCRVLRGGSWPDGPWNCRAAHRGWGVPGVRPANRGFRVVMVVGARAP